MRARPESDSRSANCYNGRVRLGRALFAVAALAGCNRAVPGGADLAFVFPDDGGAPDLSLADPCFDGTRDGDETDVDCGGATCAPCAAGEACRLDRDCA